MREMGIIETLAAATSLIVAQVNLSIVIVNDNMLTIIQTVVKGA